MRSTLLPSLLILTAACGVEPTNDDDGRPEVCRDLSTAPAGTLCIVAGLPGIAGFSPEGVPAHEAPLYWPIDMTLGPDGLLYVIDWNNHRLRRIEADGTITTIAGTGTLGDGPEGLAIHAAFNHPTNLVFHPDDPDLLYIAAWHNSRIETVRLSTGELAFVAGNGDRAFGGDGGPAVDAVLDLPSSLVFLDDGTIVLADTANQILRSIDPDGIIDTYAGTAPPGLLENGQTDRRFGWEGDGGSADEAKFNFGWGQKGFPGGRIERVGQELYIADTYNYVIRALDLDTGMIRHVAGVGLTYGFDGDDVEAATTRLDFPTDLASDAEGNVYVADTNNHCVRRLDASGTLSVVAGICTEAALAKEDVVDGLQGTESLLLKPFGVAVGDGLLYIADTENHLIRALKL